MLNAILAAPLPGLPDHLIRRLYRMSSRDNAIRGVAQKTAARGMYDRMQHESLIVDHTEIETDKILPAAHGKFQPAAGIGQLRQGIPRGNSFKPPPLFGGQKGSGDAPARFEETLCPDRTPGQWLYPGLRYKSLFANL